MEVLPIILVYLALKAEPTLERLTPHSLLLICCVLILSCLL